MYSFLSISVGQNLKVSRITFRHRFIRIRVQCRERVGAWINSRSAAGSVFFPVFARTLVTSAQWSLDFENIVDRWSRDRLVPRFHGLDLDATLNVPGNLWRLVEINLLWSIVAKTDPADYIQSELFLCSTNGTCRRVFIKGCSPKRRYLQTSSIPRACFFLLPMLLFFFLLS